MMKTLVLASNNKGKLAELKAIMRPILPECELLSLAESGFAGQIEENGSTFEENSVIKASAAAAFGRIGIGDDSGLCVDALGGRPGIYSARYSGGGDRENIEKLLKELDGVPFEKRTARFVCAAAAVFPDGRTIVRRGEVEGVILTAARGEGGFGYDPLFFYEPLGLTFAQISAQSKNQISHRANAMRALCEALGKELYNA